MIKMLFYLLIFTLSIHASDCKIIDNKNIIDLTIKSNIGWYRVCKNKKLYIYVRRYNYIYVDDICRCVEDRYKNDKRIDGGAFDEDI